MGGNSRATVMDSDSLMLVWSGDAERETFSSGTLKRALEDIAKANEAHGRSPPMRVAIDRVIDGPGILRGLGVKGQSEFQHADSTIVIDANDALAVSKAVHRLRQAAALQYARRRNLLTDAALSSEVNAVASSSMSST